ncbi:MAG: amidase [Promethearchaeota archaeon]
MNKEDIFFLPAWEMKEKIETQELTSQELTETIIGRIEKYNPLINAYCTPTFDLAREMAKVADEKVKKGEKRGILNGIPTSIKDLAMTKDIRTTFGSKIYENFVPSEDTIYVSRLKEAGIVLLGKTNTPEFGFKGVTDNLLFGTTKNPWDLTRTSGGSSGGAAAAVAAGMSPLAQGSDGGGSIRIPSCFCGLYGLKPSFGRIPVYPSAYFMGATLSHIGPIVRHVKDAALMVDAMKGPHHGDRHSLPDDPVSYYEKIEEIPKKLKIGYSMNLGYAKVVDEEVEKAVLGSVKKFEQMDWIVEESKMKLRKPELCFYTLWTSMLAYDLKSKLNEWRDKMDPELVKLVKAGLGYDGMAIMRALNQRKEIYKIFYQVFKNIDILITPTTAVPAFDLGMMFPHQINGKNVSPTAWQAFTFPLNLTWLPAASIPCGWSKKGLPIGMQIIGNRFQDLLVLQVSRAFEKLSPWQDRRPSL